MIDITLSTTIGDIVAHDLRTAAVFARHGLDFCCGGARSLADACEAQNLDSDVVLQELSDVGTAANAIDVTGWPLEQLIDHVVTTHHAYVRRAIPVIRSYAEKLVAVHGGRAKELAAIADVFHEMASELTRHMVKEEGILFPFILAMIDAKNGCGRAARTPFGTIQNPIRMMEQEHQEAGDQLWRLRTLANDYQPPAEACTTWRAFYAALADFERDLHEHVHLENYVLFPAATRLEQELVS